MVASLSRLAAVVVREMRAVARGRTGFVLRTVTAAGISAWMVVGLIDQGAIRPGLQMAEAAAGLFEGLVWVQSMAALLIGVALGIQSIRTERRDLTLGLLVLSGLRPGEITGGKMLSLMALLALVLLAPLPAYGLLGWMGGVDYRWLGVLALVCIALSALGLALGMASAVTFRSGMGAAASSAALLFLGVILLPGGGILLGLIAGLIGFLLLARFLLVMRRSWTGLFVGTFLLAQGVWFLPAVVMGLAGTLGAKIVREIHPLSVIDQVGSQEPDSLSICVGLAGMFAVAFLMWRVASGGLRAATAVSWKGGLRTLFEKLDAFYQRINLGNVVIFQPRNGSPGRRNPVAWLARTAGGSALPAHKARIALGMFLLVSLGVVLVVGDEAGFDLATLPGLALVTGGLWMGATAVAGDRERKSLAVLLSTPLDGGSILAGRALSTARFLLLVTLPPVLLYVIPLGFYDPNLAVTAVVGGLLWVGECALAFALAAACSLYLRSPFRAAVAGLLLLGIAHLLPILALASTSSALGLATTAALAAWGLCFGLLLACGALAWRAWRHGSPAAGLAALGGVYLLAPGLLLGVPVIETWWAETILQSLDDLLLGIGVNWMAVDFYSICVILFPWLALLAVLVFSYSTRTFDRAVGRAP